jgi:hypothetical protein
MLSRTLPRARPLLNGPLDPVSPNGNCILAGESMQVTTYLGQRKRFKLMGSTAGEQLQSEGSNRRGLRSLNRAPLSPCRDSALLGSWSQGTPIILSSGSVGDLRESTRGRVSWHVVTYPKVGEAFVRAYPWWPNRRMPAPTWLLCDYGRRPAAKRYYFEKRIPSSDSLRVYMSCSTLRN